MPAAVTATSQEEFWLKAFGADERVNQVDQQARRSDGAKNEIDGHIGPPSDVVAGVNEQGAQREERHGGNDEDNVEHGNAPIENSDDDCATPDARQRSTGKSVKAV
jgi:hypothetical protein